MAEPRLRSGSIAILPKLEGLGGPVSFAARLAAGLRANDFEVHNDPRQPGTAAVLVIGGTRHMDWLLSSKNSGVRVVQRLNGMNWIHKRRSTGLRHYLRAELHNWMLATIRGRIADRVVYQSTFARNWWQTSRGTTRAPARVIYNCVDLNEYSPEGPHQRPTDHTRILLVEGHLRGGYEQGLDSAVKLNQILNTEAGIGSKPFELMVAGDVPEEMRAHYSSLPGTWITWSGVLPRAQIAELDRSAHLLFSADLNAACPNSVIEALACGLPVIAFATGSLPELIQGDSGRVVPYGSNYWKLEDPDVPALAGAVKEIMANQPHFRSSARAQAEANFDIQRMIAAYQDVLLAD